MELEVILGYVVSIVSGLAVAIPLVIKLVEYVQKSIKEKNWSEVVKLVMSLMSDAETLFENGEARKDWVLAKVQTSAQHINYDIDIDVISKFIDDVCAASKIINGTKAVEAKTVEQ